MREYLQYRNRIAAISAALTAVGVLAFAQAGRLDVALGLGLGGAWSVVRFWLRASWLKKTFDGQDMGKNVRYSLGGSFTLYTMTGAVLALAFIVHGINKWAALAGVFVANAVMFAHEGLYHARMARRGP